MLHPYAAGKCFLHFTDREGAVKFWFFFKENKIITGNLVTCYTMDKLWGHYANLNKSQKGHMPYDFTYMKYLE